MAVVVKYKGNSNKQKDGLLAIKEENDLVSSHNDSLGSSVEPSPKPDENHNRSNDDLTMSEGRSSDDDESDGKSGGEFCEFRIDEKGPYLHSEPGMRLDRDYLLKSAAKILSKLKDAKEIHDFTSSVCRAFKCATNDLSKQAFDQESAMSAIAVASDSAPTPSKKEVVRVDLPIKDERNLKHKDDKEVKKDESQSLAEQAESFLEEHSEI